MGTRALHLAYPSAGQTALWAESGSGAAEIVVRGEADVRLYRGWLAKERADALLARLLTQTRWVAESRLMYGKRLAVPRLHAWYGDDRAASWPADLLSIRRELEALEHKRLHHVLLNRYRDGRDSVAWHSDHEVDHLREAVIASLTLGATRAFDLRPKADRRRIISVELDHGDLLIMAGRTQATFEHRVAKDARIRGERINLTFRQA